MTLGDKTTHKVVWSRCVQQCIRLFVCVLGNERARHAVLGSKRTQTRAGRISGP